MAKIKTKNIVLIVIVLFAFSISFGTMFFDSNICKCDKLSSTNIEVVDEDSLGTVLAFYLSNDLAITKTERMIQCNMNLNKVDFRTRESQNTLYLDDKGTVYKC